MNPWVVGLYVATILLNLAAIGITIASVGSRPR